MTDKHFNEPRDVGYSKKHRELYKEWTKTDCSAIFAGLTQADLFFLAMAIGINRNKECPIKGKKEKNIPVSAFSEEQKWAILSKGIAESQSLLVLQDEKSIYEMAERYAEEGLSIIKSHIEKNGLNYPKFLEAELRDIINKVGRDEKGKL